MAEYIKKKDLIEFACRHIDGKLDANDIARFPTADVVPVVRCKDCVHSVKDEVGRSFCEFTDCYCGDTSFCNYGERKITNE